MADGHRRGKEDGARTVMADVHTEMEDGVRMEKEVDAAEVTSSRVLSGKWEAVVEEAYQHHLELLLRPFC